MPASTISVAFNLLAIIDKLSYRFLTYYNIIKLTILVITKGFNIGCLFCKELDTSNEEYPYYNNSSDLGQDTNKEVKEANVVNNIIKILKGGQ